MEINFDIILTKSQQEALDIIDDEDTRVLTLAWSRQSGKSTLMKLVVIKWLLTMQNVKIAYICRTYMLAKRFFLDLTQSLSNVSDITLNSSEFTIRYGTSTLQFFSAESGHAIRGYSFNFMILDEFAFFPTTLPDGANLYYDVLAPTMKVNGRKTIFVSTPNGKANLFHEMYQRGINGKQGYKSLRKTIYEDGLVSSDAIEEIKKNVPTLTFQQEYLVEFIDGGQTLFKGFELCFNQETFNNDKTWIGVDFSSRGEDRTILTILDNDNNAKQTEIKGSLDQRYRYIANIINAQENLQNCLMENNSIGTPMINEIKKLVDSKYKHRIGEFNTSHKSKDEIISSLAVAISNGAMHFLPDDHELYAELSNFGVTYTKSGNAKYEALTGHDDRVMSLAIALKAKEKSSYTISKNTAFITSPTITIT